MVEQVQGAFNIDFKCGGNMVGFVLVLLMRDSAVGDSRERKKRPHLVKKLNHKSIKEGIQMKQNRIFDQNSSQKARSWHYNMDTNRAEAQFADGSAIAIDCLAIEDEYGNTPAQRAELDWLLYNKPLECVQLVLSGEIEHYLSLGCDHGKLKD